MTYKLTFKQAAEKEWRKLDEGIKTKFRKKLIERKDNPHIPADKLRGIDNAYKIKLRNDGYRLVYEVRDDQLIISVISVGKRDKSTVYKRAMARRS